MSRDRHRVKVSGVQARVRAICMKRFARRHVRACRRARPLRASLVFPPESPHTNAMEAEHEQVLVRRKKLAELRAARAARPIRTTSARATPPASSLARWNETPARDARGATPVPVALAGRLMAIRDFGKAAFVAAAGSRRAACRSTCSATRSASDDFARVPPARPRRLRRRRGAALPHQDQRADGPRVDACTSSPRPAPAAREVARPAGRRDPLPPALPRSDRQPRGARVFATRAAILRASARSSPRAASSRSRRR